MDKKRFIQSIFLSSVLTIGHPEPVFACDSPPCQEHNVTIEYINASNRPIRFTLKRSGLIGNLSVSPGLPERFNLYLSYNLNCEGGTKTDLLVIFWNSPPQSYRIISIDNCSPKKYILWVDTFRGSKGILWGMFQGAPDGCTVVGAYVDGDSPTFYRGNLKNSEVDFGYQLAKEKEGYPSPPPDIDFNSLPINFRDSRYEQYYFRANWVSPNCYWQVREVRRHSFGGIFDFLWNLFK